MKYNPHDYQIYAINFIKEHPIAAILLDMGMGKTSIVLAALNDLMFDSFDVTKVLIIAPLRVAKHTWSAEIQKWDQLRGLRYSIAVGTAAERMKALQADADIYIINRENVPWLIEKSGLPFDYDMVVIDELSSFKNWQAKRFKALMKVRPRVKRIVGLTGTPSSNGLMDLFAEYKVLDMGERLGRFISQYRVEYFVPDQTNGPIVYSYRLRKGADKRCTVGSGIHGISLCHENRGFFPYCHCNLLCAFVIYSYFEESIQETCSQTFSNKGIQSETCCTGGGRRTRKTVSGCHKEESGSRISCRRICKPG